MTVVLTGIPQRTARFLHASRIAALVAVALVTLFVGACGSSGKAAVAPSPRDPQTPSAVVPLSSAPGTQPGQAMDAFVKEFYFQNTNGLAYFHDSTLGGRSDFWKEAELIEMVEDAYQKTGDPAYKQAITPLMDDVLHFYSANWLRRKWNDDNQWMIIAALRAYDITGDARYLKVARKNWDGTYARAWDTTFGGGLWWTTDKTQKNTTTVAPAIIGACMLAKDTGDKSYITKAVALYDWERKTLFDAATGSVYDNIAPKAGGGSVLTKYNFTYNQGSFIGAADDLNAATGNASYLADAERALAYVKTSMTAVGSPVVRSEGIVGVDGNGGGFKGIFFRYAVQLATGHHLTSYYPWFHVNADAALVTAQRPGPHQPELDAADARGTAPVLVRLLVGGGADQPAHRSAVSRAAAPADGQAGRRGPQWEPDG